MTTTLTFPHYRRESVSLDDRRADQSVPSTGDYEGLSGFNIPVSVDVEIVPEGNLCRFQFSYTDNEPGEGALRRVPGSEHLLLRLGEVSKKVTEIVLENAREVLLRGPVYFDPRSVMGWAVELPSRPARILMRNAVVVSNILQDMPRELQHGIVNLLRRQ